MFHRVILKKILLDGKFSIFLKSWKTTVPGIFVIPSQPLSNMDQVNTQVLFFQHIKSLLPAHKSLVDEIADDLEISIDSAYRRIRGEKPIALHELKQLCERYHISLDKVLELKNEHVLFRTQEWGDTESTFEYYLQRVLEQVKYFNAFKEKRLLYLVKDIPLWDYFLFPEIAAFKTFFWTRTILPNSPGRNKQFSLDEFSFEKTYAIGQEILREICRIPCVELLNFESFNSTIGQAAFYRDAGMIADDKTFAAIMQSFYQTIDHLELQTEKGTKFLPGQENMNNAPTEVYLNEVILGNNSILVELDGKRETYLTYNVLNFMGTGDERFNSYSFSTFEKLRNRSVMISGTGEKDRKKFFRVLRTKLRELEKM